MKTKSIFTYTLLLTLFATTVRADLAPGPEDPCYGKKSGDVCETEKGEAGICKEVCYDRFNPETGKKMYQTCHKACSKTDTGSKPEETPQKSAPKH